MDNPEKLTTLGTQNEDKQNRKRNTICVEHDYAKTNIYNVNKAWALLQTIGGKDEPIIVFKRKS